MTYVVQWRGHYEKTYKTVSPEFATKGEAEEWKRDNHARQLIAVSAARVKEQIDCVCGRKFTNRAAFANHARKCPQEQARSAEFIRRIEQGTTRRAE